MTGQCHCSQQHAASTAGDDRPRPPVSGASTKDFVAVRRWSCGSFQDIDPELSSTRARSRSTKSVPPSLRAWHGLSWAVQVGAARSGLQMPHFRIRSTRSRRLP